MRTHHRNQPSVSFCGKPAQESKPRTFFAHAMVALLLLFGGTWSHAASAASASPTCDLAIGSPNFAYASASQTVTFPYNVNCTLGKVATGAISINSDTTAGATLPPGSVFDGNDGAHSFTLKLGTTAGTAVVYIDCTNCGTTTHLEYDAYISPSPSIALGKVLTSNADGDGSGNVTQGDVLTYTVTATNNGNETLTNLVINDPLLTAPNNTTTCASVAIGATCVLTGTYTVSAADLANHSVNNTATAMSYETCGMYTCNSVSATLNTRVFNLPSMTVAKTLSHNADGDKSGSVTKGDALTYLVTATNNGDAPLSNVVVNDPLTTPNTHTCATVQPGATCQLHGIYTVTASDAANGSINNTGSATADRISGSVTSTLNTPVYGSPAMTVTKVLTSNADGDGSGTVTRGDLLTYTVTATNIGGTDLNNVQVSDPLTTPGTMYCESIAIGSSCVLTGTYTVNSSDENNRAISNTGSATSTEIAKPVNATLRTPVVASNQALTVSKVLTSNADGDGSGSVTSGDVLTYTVTATNSGNVILHRVRVDDPLTSPSSTECTEVAPGATCVLSGTYTVSDTDAANKSISNTGSASILNSDGFPTSTVNTTLRTPVSVNAAMTLTKVLASNADGDHSGNVTAGDVLTYTVTATNTGATTLTNVQVNDPLTTPSATHCTSVPVGGSCALSGTYTVTSADADNGYLINTGSATAAQLSSPASVVHTTVVGSDPEMTITKALTSNADGDGSHSVTAGDVLTYTVTATNIGSYALSNVQVTDPLTTPNATSCSSVAAGASCVLTGTYTVTTTDVHNGSISNTASASRPNGDFPSTISTTLHTAVGSVGQAAMTVTKVLSNNADGDGSHSVTAGDVLTYAVTATNTGSIALTNVQVSDPLTAPNTTTCANVAVGANCVLSGTYTVTASDASNGSISNTGSAIATQIATPVTKTLSTAVGTTTAALTVTKVLTSNADGDGSHNVTVGDVLTYTVTATNSGNIVLTNVQVSDPLTTPNAATCANVAIGATCVLSGTYTVTAANATSGSISNTGSAVATQITTPVTKTLNTTVATATAALSLTKVLTSNADGDHSGTVTAGDVLTYTVTATNAGNIPLTNVQVSDPLTTPNATSCANVAVSATCVLAGTYTVTTTDASNGSISNTGSATATLVNTPVTSTINTQVVGAVVDHVIQIEDGDNQSGPPNTALSSLEVDVGDVINGLNHQANGVTVNWAVTSGTATLSNPTSIVYGGGASIGVTLGATPGPVTITATRADYPTQSVTFHETITGTVGTPTLTKVSGDNQAGVVGTHAPQPLVVHLVDADGNPSEDEIINWQVISGPAVLDANISGTGDGGQDAQVGFSFGTSTGNSVIRATFGMASVDFNATTQSYQIAIVSGNGQTAAPGQPLPQDLVVQVSLPSDTTTLARTQGAHVQAVTSALAGIPVQWNVLSGGGSLSQGASTVTDASGHATNHVTLGASAGLNQVQVVVPGGASVTFNATSSAAVTATLQVVSGSPQTLTTNTPSAPLVVVLTTNSGVPIPNATVTWSATNATLASATSLTDSSGHASNIATVTNPGAATVTASSSAPSAGPVTFALNGGISHLGGLTPQQVQIANAFDHACPALAALSSPTPQQQDLLQQCQALAFSAGADPDQARNALDQMFSSVAFLQTSAAMLISTTQFDNIKARIAALRSGTGGTHFGGLAFRTPDSTMPIGSIGDSLLGFAEDKDKKQEAGSGFDRWGFFASGTFSNGSVDPRQVTPGYGFQTNGLTAGVDYRISDQLIFGVSAGYSKYNSDVNAGRGGMDTQGWSLSAYSTLFRKDNWYVDGVLTFGNNTYDISRQIIYTLTTNAGTTSVNQQANSNSSGSTLLGALTFGRDFSKGAWSFGPYFRGMYTRIGFDDYHETLQSSGPGNGLGLAVEGRDVKSTAAVLGAKVNYASSRSWGVMMPHVEVEWEHDFQDSPDSVTARFLNDPTSTPIHVDGDAIDTDFFRLGLGMSFVFTGGRSGFIYYEKTLGRSGVTQDNLAIGLRLEF